MRKKKSILGTLALLASATLGCSGATVKSQTEIWLIDPTDVVLYRVISDSQEEALPIKGNIEMKRMRCVDESEIRRWDR